MQQTRLFGAEDEDRIIVVTGGHVYDTAKRVLDAVIASCLLVLTVPFLVLIAVLVKLDSPGPVLFRQARVGRDGKLFTFYKFRSMQNGANPELHRKIIEEFIRNQTFETDGQGSSSAPYKIVNDPRVTRFGKLLRRTSLDEMPQLINVLRGEMSLVGPRPPLEYEVEKYQEWHKARLTVLPGITGLWQVRGRSRVGFDDMVRMDLDYIANRSLRLDLKILILTLPAVLSTKGAR